MRPRSISLSIHGGREGENTPGPEIEVDLEIPAIPYQVEHVRRMSSDDEADHICDVTRNEVIEYLGESLSSQNNEWRLMPPNKIDWAIYTVIVRYFLSNSHRREYGRQHT